MVVEEGMTVRLSGLEATLCENPSDQVTVQGPVPVSAAEISAELLLQIFVSPLTTAVGRGFTVTVARLESTVPPQPETTT